MSISLNTLKLHNERVEELLKKVEDNFQWQPVHPKEELASIMYRAGQASVVEYIKQLIGLKKLLLKQLQFLVQRE